MIRIQAGQKQKDKLATLTKLLWELLQSEEVAVFATSAAGQPYTSLVAFVATKDLHYLILATNRATQKFANVQSDNRVALLVDNRKRKKADFQKAVGVMAIGVAEIIPPNKTARCIELYLHKHPPLRDFIHDPESVILKVRVHTYQIVQHFQDSIFLEVIHKVKESEKRHQFHNR